MIAGLCRIFVAVLVLAAGRLSAQSAGTTRSGSDTGTFSYTVNGLRVIQRLAPNSDIVVANLYLLGGVRQMTAANAGIELLLMESSDQGTKTFPRDRLRRLMARLGTSITTSVTQDWSVIGVQATRETLDSTWMVLASRVKEPALDSSAVELVRQRLLAGVRQRADVPDALLEYVADSFAFAGHPYALAPSGTETSLRRITLGELREYQASQMVKSRMLVVVVGNVSRRHMEELLNRTMGSLPAGSYAWTLPDTLPHRASSVHTIDRPLPTNYILGKYAGPRADSPDYHALRIATAILSGQLFSEIRSRRNLTYAVDAPFVEQAVSSGGLYVTTVSPEVTLEIMRRQIQDLQNGSIDPEGLDRLILQFITRYFLDNETSTQQADFLARAALYYGDFRRADRFVDELRAITPYDIRRAARLYMHDIQFVYLGDTRKAPISLMRRF